MNLKEEFNNMYYYYEERSPARSIAKENVKPKQSNEKRDFKCVRMNNWGGLKTWMYNYIALKTGTKQVKEMTRAKMAAVRIVDCTLVALLHRGAASQADKSSRRQLKWQRFQSEKWESHCVPTRRDIWGGIQKVFFGGVCFSPLALPLSLLVWRGMNKDSVYFNIIRVQCL